MFFDLSCERDAVIGMASRYASESGNALAELHNCIASVQSVRHEPRVQLLFESSKLSCICISILAARGKEYF